MGRLLSRRAPFWLIALLFIVLVLTGCDQNGGSENSKAEAPPKPEVKVEEVRLETADGLTLRGNLYGQGDIGVVLAHMFPADQSSWSDFAKELAASGDYTVLTFNFRGYGLSEGVKNIARIDNDVQAALDHLKEETAKVYLIGASMGGTAALSVASTRDVAGVATLSAPRRFEGLSVGDKLDQVGGAKLFIAARKDGNAPDDARYFYDSVGEPRELEIVTGEAHGTDMLEVPPSTVEDLLKNWLAKTR